MRAAILREGSLRRIWGLLYRHLSLYRRSWPRVLELAYWPTLQMCIWGFTSSFFLMRGGPPGDGLVAAGALLGGVLLWEVALRSQMGVSVTFLEEIWSRNLGHVFVSPVRPWEMLAAMFAMSVLRMLAGVVPAALLAYLLYAFDVFRLGPALVLFMACLMAMGWAVALGVVSLILRHGLGAEALAWALLFGVAPLSAVFYPVSVYPSWLRPVSLALPSTHVFEGMRAALRGSTSWGHLAWAAGLDAAWLALAMLLFATQFRAARMRGALVSVGE